MFLKQLSQKVGWVSTSDHTSSTSTVSTLRFITVHETPFHKNVPQRKHPLSQSLN